MTSFDRQGFVEFLLDNKAVGFFEKPVTLKSGRQSSWYVNWRRISNDVFLLDRLSDFLIAFVEERGFLFDAFYGVPEGATKLAILATFKRARGQRGFGPGSHSLPMGRGKPKEHGAVQDRFFVGEPRGNVVVVEDVTTTGESLLTALAQLREAKVGIAAAVGLTNRMERRDDGSSVAEAVVARGAPYFSLSEATDFLPEAFRREVPGEAIGRAVEEEFRRHGVRELRLFDRQDRHDSPHQY